MCDNVVRVLNQGEENLSLSHEPGSLQKKGEWGSLLNSHVSFK